jgi:Ribosomal protein L6, N-terminal domain
MYSYNLSICYVLKRNNIRPLYTNVHAFLCHCSVLNFSFQKMVKNKNKGKPRNYALASGVYRFGASKTFHKKAIYKFLKKTTAKKPVEKKAVFVEKKIGGDKNGGTR